MATTRNTAGGQPRTGQPQPADQVETIGRVEPADRVRTDTGRAESAETGSLQFIGNATTLLRLGPFTVLTDPNFLHRGQKASIGYGLVHITRLTEPALLIEQLPPLDLIVLSHNHEDHFDRIACERLDKSIPILTTPEAARALRKNGFRAARALETWERAVRVDGDWSLTVTALPGQHGPGPLGFPFLPRVMGSLIELRRLNDPASLRIYVSGDTLIHENLHEIPARFPDIDLGLFHLGGTRIFGLMVTMDGEQGARAVQIIQPHTAIPIHYDDYDAFKSPLDDFRQAVHAAGLDARVQYVERGETIPLPPATRKR